MLSIEDIYREIGKNIFICPLKIDNFRDNSIDLTASEFAWTPDGTNIFDEEKRTITVPGHKTACILTKEAIYVTKKIGGTYHSRVSLVKKGFGHIGTMLDPEYCGQSLIMLHNTTDSDLVLKEGERLVSLAFYYLKTPIGREVRTTPPSHSNKVAEMDKEGRYQEWCDANQWANNPFLLKTHFKECHLEEFKKKRKERAQNKTVFAKIWSSTAGRIAVKYVLITAIIAVVLIAIVRFFPPADPAGWAGILLPVVICLIGVIANDINKR